MRRRIDSDWLSVFLAFIKSQKVTAILFTIFWTLPPTWVRTIFKNIYLQVSLSLLFTASFFSDRPCCVVPLFSSLLWTWTLSGVVYLNSSVRQWFMFLGGGQLKNLWLVDLLLQTSLGNSHEWICSSSTVLVILCQTCFRQQKLHQ